MSSSSELPAETGGASESQPFVPGRFAGRTAIVNVSSEASLRASASGVASTASTHA